MYLTFEEYKDMGGTLEEAAFNNYEFEARAQIDYWTFHRLRDESEYPEEVKRCVYKLIELLVEAKQAKTISTTTKDGMPADTASISSMSNDGVSVSYNVLGASEANTLITEDIRTTVNHYLDGVKNSLGQKLLYRGLYRGE